MAEGLKASYTIEAAGVMAAIGFCMLVLLSQAFRFEAESRGGFQLHEAVERERHALENRDQKEIRKKAAGNFWDLEICAPVFRPENSLRLWSLAEDWE